MLNRTRLFLVALLCLALGPSLGACCGRCTSRCDVTVVAPREPTAAAPSAEDQGAATPEPTAKPADAGETKTLAGAASPEEFVSRARKIAEENDISLIIPLLLPEQRAAVTMLLGVLPQSMVMALAESLGNTPSAGDPEEAKARQANFAAWKKEWKALLAKYDIQIPESGSGPTMFDMTKPKTEEQKRALLKALGEPLAHVDHQAFLRESMALMEKHSDPASAGMTKGPSQKFALKDVQMQVEGDTATLTVPAEKTPLVLVKRDGRWYIDMAKSM